MSTDQLACMQGGGRRESDVGRDAGLLPTRESLPPRDEPLRGSDPGHGRRLADSPSMSQHTRRDPKPSQAGARREHSGMSHRRDDSPGHSEHQHRSPLSSSSRRPPHSPSPPHTRWQPQASKTEVLPPPPPTQPLPTPSLPLPAAGPASSTSPARASALTQQGDQLPLPRSPQLPAAATGSEAPAGVPSPQKPTVQESLPVVTAEETSMHSSPMSPASPQPGLHSLLNTAQEVQSSGADVPASPAGIAPASPTAPAAAAAATPPPLVHIPHPHVSLIISTGMLPSPAACAQVLQTGP